MHPVALACPGIVDRQWTPCRSCNTARRGAASSARAVLLGGRGIRSAICCAERRAEERKLKRRSELVACQRRRKGALRNPCLHNKKPRMPPPSMIDHSPKDDLIHPPPRLPSSLQQLTPATMDASSPHNNKKNWRDKVWLGWFVLQLLAIGCEWGNSFW